MHVDRVLEQQNNGQEVWHFQTIVIAWRGRHTERRGRQLRWPCTLVMLGFERDVVLLTLLGCPLPAPVLAFVLRGGGGAKTGAENAHSSFLFRCFVKLPRL